MNIWKSLHEFIAELMGIELEPVNNPCGVDS
jgi:hypothetical protein